MEDLLTKHLPHMDFYRTNFQQFFYYPYIMQTNLPLYRSELVNTDSLGFRLTKKPDGGWIGFDDTDAGECANLFIGGSTAMGWGSRNGDAGTIPSFLAEISGEKWLNMSVCGQSIQNNHINLFLLSHRLKNIRRVVFLGGYNELAIFLNGNYFSKTYGGIYNQTEFQNTMNRHLDDLKRSEECWQGDFIKLPENSLEKKDDFEKWLRGTLDAIATNLSHRKISFLFLIQPYFEWIERSLTEVEIKITRWCAESHARACKKQFYNQIRDSKKWYFELLKNHCKSIGVSCIDLNEEFSNQTVPKMLVFFDPAHLSDEANHFIAQRILR